MFLPFLQALRLSGLPVGVSEFLRFREALATGLITDLRSLHRIARAIFCRSEADYEGFQRAFLHVFEGLELPPELRSRLEDWLSGLADPPGPTRLESREAEALWKALLQLLQEQKERHDGGARFIGTGGTSPFGHSGRSSKGIRLGGRGGGGRSVIRGLDESWEAYRTDRSLSDRDQQVALRALRQLVREGDLQLDLEESIAQTARNGGEVELVERRSRENRLRLVLLMDAGGSMGPHARRVQQLLTVATTLRAFKSFEAYAFHNCVYGHLIAEGGSGARVPTPRVLDRLTPQHRLIFVGDASMAPYELFSGYGWPGEEAVAGLEWLRRFRARCATSVWLNPDPVAYWNHPTVEAIGQVFPMFELTLDGLRRAVRALRHPAAARVAASGATR